jgi:hypothetical protein
LRFAAALVLAAIVVLLLFRWLQRAGRQKRSMSS